MGLKFDNHNPKPIILPPETMPSTPYPTPVVEIPGFFKKKSILSIIIMKDQVVIKFYIIKVYLVDNNSMLENRIDVWIKY